MIYQIDMISDPNCPFCALGYLQLQKALEDMGEQNVHLKWHPYFINPNLSPEGKDVRENLKEKYGMEDATIEAAFDRFKMQGEALGFEYDYPEGKRVYPSDRAHQLVAWMPEDLRSKAELALMQKFFTESKNFHDVDVLVEVVVELGLDGDEAKQVIENGYFAEEVERNVSYWQQQGVEGVPSFIFNEKYFLSGAIGVHGFKNVFQQIKNQSVVN